MRELVKQMGPKNWKRIAERLEYRTDVQCLHRWQKVLNPEMVKGMAPLIGVKLPLIWKVASVNSAANDGTTT